MTPEAHPQNYLKNTQKSTKNSSKIHFFVIFEYFSGNLGGGPFGSYLVIFEYFRVRGIWVSLTGALNRKLWGDLGSLEAFAQIPFPRCLGRTIHALSERPLHVNGAGPEWLRQSVSAALKSFPALGRTFSRLMHIPALGEEN